MVIMGVLIKTNAISSVGEGLVLFWLILKCAASPRDHFNAILEEGVHLLRISASFSLPHVEWGCSC